MMERIKDITISALWFITSPIWIVFLIIVLATLPKQFWEDYDEYLESME